MQRIRIRLTLKIANENLLFLFLRSVLFCALPSPIDHFWIQILCFFFFFVSGWYMFCISLTSHNIQRQYDIFASIFYARN